jgi:hypothetical protein
MAPPAWPTRSCIADSLVKQRSRHTSSPRALNSGARAGPFPFFRPSRKRRWSAGRRHRRIAAGWRTQIRGPPRATAGPLLPGVAASGALAQRRRARRLPALQRDAIVGHRILLRLRTPRSTTPSIERGWPYRTKREQNVKCGPGASAWQQRDRRRAAPSSTPARDNGASGANQWKPLQLFRSSGTLPPFSASFCITCLCSQMFIEAESFMSPV